MKQFKAKIVSNEKIATDHYMLSFKALTVAPHTKPGQFFNIRISSSYKPLLRRPFGAHRVSRDTVYILYKVVGEATRMLSSKRSGDALDIIGPLGKGFNISPSRRTNYSSYILVAGGHGVAPLVGLAERLSNKEKSISMNVFIGARTKKHVVCEKEFKKLKAKTHIATEDGSKGHKGLITELLDKHISPEDKGPSAIIYACGPKPMLEAVTKFAKRYQLACQISLEEYMACGIGTCLGCAVNTKSGYKLVCKDGPVFDAREIVWE